MINVVKMIVDLFWTQAVMMILVAYIFMSVWFKFDMIEQGVEECLFLGQTVVMEGISKA